MSPTLTNWFFRKRNHRRQKPTTITHTANKDLIMPPNKMKIKITGSCDSDAEKKIPTTTSFSRKIGRENCVFKFILFSRFAWKVSITVGIKLDFQFYYLGIDEAFNLSNTPVKEILTRLSLA